MFSTAKRSALTISILAALSAPSQADIQGAMESVFDGMVQTTDPDTYDTARRGVISGGRATAKIEIVDVNMITFAPPSWKAGCGGVDLFGGSLSFINADQIVQLLRSVAANAKGYMFQLALSTVFPSGATHLENFQKKIQQLNQYLGNSCQLAQGIVNDTLGGMGVQTKSDASITNTVQGISDDIFSSWSGDDSESAESKYKNADPDSYSATIGNVVWEQFRYNDVENWFVGGDTSLLEAIMSMTGAVIIEDIEDSTTPKSTSYLPGNLVSLEDLLKGGSTDIYDCSSDEEKCMINASTTQTVNLKGTIELISEALLGVSSSDDTSGSRGIIYKFSQNSDTLTASEKAVLSNLPEGVGAMVRNLAVLSSSSAILFANDAAKSIALDITYQFAEESFKAAIEAMANKKGAVREGVEEKIEDNLVFLREEYARLSASEFTPTYELMSKYQGVIESTRKTKYLLSRLNNSAGE
tara:strand:- start:3438 stop:4847 length:1410 start_codon:yes stop_codon:yes gene_type:complete